MEEFDLLTRNNVGKNGKFSFEPSKKMYGEATVSLAHGKKQLFQATTGVRLAFSLKLPRNEMTLQMGWEEKSKFCVHNVR